MISCKCLKFGHELTDLYFLLCTLKSFKPVIVKHAAKSPGRIELVLYFHSQTGSEARNEMIPLVADAFPLVSSVKLNEGWSNPKCLLVLGLKIRRRKRCNWIF